MRRPARSSFVVGSTWGRGESFGEAFVTFDEGGYTPVRVVGFFLLITTPWTDWCFLFGPSFNHLKEGFWLEVCVIGLCSPLRLALLGLFFPDLWFGGTGTGTWDFWWER